VRIVIAGGHGKIALILERLLSERGDSVAGLIRNPAQVADLEAAGAEAVVFAAGAGPGSGAARKETVDRDAAILLADAALDAGVRRYLMISAMGADRLADAAASDAVFAAYLRAKAAADEAVLARRALATTVVRPGLLTDAAATGMVTIASQTGRGSIPRADVAAVLVALLDAPETAGHTFELIDGDTPIADAVSWIGS
jgi:uncharacterized protein YbjT (DUF2867 family)